jgi:cyanate permease
MYVGAIWKLAIPPRVQFFLWLLANNKTLTRDNLAKRREVNDPSCLFCNEQESVVHLFFGCIVARYVWVIISEMLSLNLGATFESIA